MDVRLCFKTPDVADYALEDLDDEQRAKAEAAIAKYVEYGENVVIDIDLDTHEATVVRVNS